MSLGALSFQGRALSLRRASGADWPALLGLLEETEDWMGEEGPWDRGHHRGQAEVLRAWIDEHEWVLAEEASELAAAVLLMRDDPRWAGYSGEAVYVHKLIGRRGRSWRGVGKALLDWVEAREEGRSGRVRLDTSVASPGLVRFYERAGYHARGEIDEPPWRLRLFEKMVRSEP